MSNSTKQQPDDLMNHFQGLSLKKIVIFTILVHFVVILVTSIPFLLGTFKDLNEDKSEEERTELAIKEANETLAKIAKSYDIQTAQLRSKMAGGSRPAPKPADDENPEPTGSGDGTGSSEPTGSGEPDTAGEGEIRGDSEIEQTLKQKLPPPTLPPVDNTDDLFK